jgi:hypothetical protein
MNILVSIFTIPTEIRNCIRILVNHFSDRDEYELTKNDMITLFSAPSFSLCYQLLISYVNNNNDETIRIFLEIWKTGLSYEDFLHELDSSFQLIEYVPSAISQEIHELLIKGWINFAQGKTHTLDMMRLFLRPNDKSQE